MVSEVLCDFLELSSVKNLQKLAKSKKISFQKADIAALLQERHLSAPGWELYFPFEKVDGDILEELYLLCEENSVKERMKDLFLGKKVNVIEGLPSENRAVSHPLMRDIFENRLTGSEENTTLFKENLEEHKKLKNFLEATDGKFDSILQIGIGGSDLGTQAIYEGLKKWRQQGREIHFLSNIDPDHVVKTVEQIDLERTLVVVISKSGKTLETCTNEAWLRSIYEKAGLNPASHFVYISSVSPKDSSLYLESFYVPESVGGRYSVTSMVGAVVLSFVLGYDLFLQFLMGAHHIDQHVIGVENKKNLPLLMACLDVWNCNFLHLPTTCILPYADVLKLMPFHFQQLEMESNGKSVSLKGKAISYPTSAIIWGGVGTSSQHSFFQLLHQGTPLAHLEFIGVKKEQYGEDFMSDGTSSQEKLLSNLFAQMVAFAVGKETENPNKICSGGRPNLLLWTEEITPYTLGALLSIYEHKTAYQGFLLGINSFDQEGVELGKVMANRFIKAFLNKREGKEVEADLAPWMTLLNENAQ